MSDNVLKDRGLKVAYGGIKAVKGIDLEVNKGELVTLIGANGAGKTTTLKAITGTLPACKVEGTMSYMGNPWQALNPSTGEQRSWRWCRKGGACSPA
jgi:branched-chain amino acid transport system ATP-binding protein